MPVDWASEFRVYWRVALLVVKQQLPAQFIGKRVDTVRTLWERVVAVEVDRTPIREFRRESVPALLLTTGRERDRITERVSRSSAGDEQPSVVRHFASG